MRGEQARTDCRPGVCPASYRLDLINRWRMNFEADSIVEKLLATPIFFCAITGPVTRHVCIIDHKAFFKIEEAAVIFWFLCVLNHG